MQAILSPIERSARHDPHTSEYSEQPTESSPLLSNQHESTNSEGIRSRRVVVVMSLLLILLTCGVIIAIYLLIEQEKPLPPVDTPLRLVAREQWEKIRQRELFQLPSPSKYVIVVHSNTEECNTTAQCTRLVTSIKNFYGSIPYNFMVSSNGQTYEGLGWKSVSPFLHNVDQSVITLAFLGNYTSRNPSKIQVQEAISFIQDGISLQKLPLDLTLVAVSEEYTPKTVLNSLNKYNWEFKPEMFFIKTTVENSIREEYDK